MFTGIVQSVGEIISSQEISDGVELYVNPGKLSLDSTSLGDSVSVNGVCLTVTDVNNGIMRFDVSKETLSKCLVENWQKGTRVNLETALTLETPIGGHLVSGHVDGTATLQSRKDGDEFSHFVFNVNSSLGRFVATKGSVALDGVSLTSNSVSDDKLTVFDVMLVPHTLQNTTLGDLHEGHLVHLEVDQISRYVHRLYQFDRK